MRNTGNQTGGSRDTRFIIDLFDALLEAPHYRGHYSVLPGRVSPDWLAAELTVNVYEPNEDGVKARYALRMTLEETPHA